jgi:hypothetical protein
MPPKVFLPVAPWLSNEYRQLRKKNTSTQKTHEQQVESANLHAQRPNTVRTDFDSWRLIAISASTMSLTTSLEVCSAPVRYNHSWRTNVWKRS